MSPYFPKALEQSERGPNNQTQSSKTSTFDRAKCSLPTKISARSEISWKNVKVLIMKPLPENTRMSAESLI